MKKKDKEEAFKRYGQKCFICETTSNLEIAHLVSLHQGGTNEIENLRPICSICHSILDKTSFREFEFEKYLQRLISANKNFKNTEPQKRVGIRSKFRIDLYTERNSEILHIEAKAISYLQDDRMEKTVNQIQKYTSNNSTLVFAFPGICTEEQKQSFVKYGIEVWDIPKTLEIFKEQKEKGQIDVFISADFLDDNCGLIDNRTEPDDCGNCKSKQAQVTCPLQKRDIEDGGVFSTHRYQDNGADINHNLVLNPCQ